MKYLIEFTEQEERLFVDCLKNNVLSMSWELLKKAYERGDVKKVENENDLQRCNQQEREDIQRKIDI